jgi:hypothetical protein
LGTKVKKAAKLIITIAVLLSIAIFLAWGYFTKPVSISCNKDTIGAEIYIDGKLKTRFNTNVSDFRVWRGRHEFRVTKLGYRDTTFDTSVTNEIYPYVELQPLPNTTAITK